MHAVCENHGFRPLKRGGPGGELALRQAHVKWRSHSGAVWILRFSPVSLGERAIPGLPGMMGYMFRFLNEELFFEPKNPLEITGS